MIFTDFISIKLNTEYNRTNLVVVFYITVIAMIFYLKGI